MTTTPPELSDGRRRHPSAARALEQRFAHPSERQFARLLDLYGIEWVYEPVEFPLRWGSDGAVSQAFRPDFWLPAHHCFVELTTQDQRLVTRKNAKARRFRELYPELDLVVLYQRDYLALVERHRIAPVVGSAA